MLTDDCSKEVFNLKSKKEKQKNIRSRISELEMELQHLYDELASISSENKLPNNTREKNPLEKNIFAENMESDNLGDLKEAKNCLYLDRDAEGTYRGLLASSDNLLANSLPDKEKRTLLVTEDLGSGSNSLDIEQVTEEPYKANEEIAAGAEQRLLNEKEGSFDGPHPVKELRLSSRDDVDEGLVDYYSSSQEKIDLFLSLFKGRSDVCAKRWKNKPGYSPYCFNDFRPGVCQKPKVKCSNCKYSDFASYNAKQIQDHLLGKTVLGLYPLTKEDGCYLLVMDLDDDHWQEDAQVIRELCIEHELPVSLERSRSGQGGHLWFFFQSELKAATARRFGMALLELAMTESKHITFDSFDRLFPSQDLLPRDGFGNLIALPLQKEARGAGNTVFLDEDFNVIQDQWLYLSKTTRISKEEIEGFLATVDNLMVEAVHERNLFSFEVDDFNQAESEKDLVQGMLSEDQVLGSDKEEESNSRVSHTDTDSHIDSNSDRYSDRHSDRHSNRASKRHSKSLDGDKRVVSKKGRESKRDGSIKHLRQLRQTRNQMLKASDLPDCLTIIQENGLIMEKRGISQRGILALRHLASYGNPEFFAKQAMRISTYGIPRMTVAYEEDAEMIRLPRGVEPALVELLESVGVQADIQDKRISGRTIDVEFKGQLTDHQEQAFQAMVDQPTGVLAATTGFGKTVIAAKMIAAIRRPTLILVHTKELAAQWRERLNQFLTINETVESKRKVKSVIGQIGGGKKNPHGIIDIALIQSMVNRDKSVKDHIHGYGLIVVDECHHISAVNFSRVLSQANARYVYGLTATPIRKDGHHPIVFMQCGAIRYRVNAKEEAKKRDFTHSIIPRFTATRLPLIKPKGDWHITEVYETLVQNQKRNQLIVQDVVKVVEEGSRALVLTERTQHLQILKDMLQENGVKVLVLYGAMKTKERKQVIEQIKTMEPSESFVLLATGRLIGEGFDEASLDTLFLTFPIAWKGTIAQYAGRLHRSYEGKTEVKVYDYVDVHIPVLDRMYHKRLKAYHSVGYSLQTLKGEQGSPSSMFEGQDYLTQLKEDIKNTQQHILISSPTLNQRKVNELQETLLNQSRAGCRVTLCTRSTNKKWKDQSNQRTHQVDLEELTEKGFYILQIPTLHYRFILLDENILWYGSSDPLGKDYENQTFIRIESSQLAQEFMTALDEIQDKT